MKSNIVSIAAFMIMVLLPVTGITKNVSICGNNYHSEQLIKLIQNHQLQNRNSLKCHQKLNEIALIKAKLIIANDDIWHNAGHMTPNQLLRYHGFKLPRAYPIFGNQVEALAGGEESVEEVFKGFLSSEPHRKLLLGEDDFFKTQDQIGAAFVKDLSTAHEYYWVVIIAGEKNHNIQQDPVIEVKPPVFTQKKPRGKEIKDKLYRNKGELLSRSTGAHGWRMQ